MFGHSQDCFAWWNGLEKTRVSRGVLSVHSKDLFDDGMAMSRISSIVFMLQAYEFEVSYS